VSSGCGWATTRAATGWRASRSGRLLETHPQLHTKILRNIGISLATKLRKVNEDVRILIAERE